MYEPAWGEPYWSIFDEKLGRPRDKRMAQILKNEPFSNLVDLEDIDNRDFQIA